MSTETVQISAIVRKETDKALLIFDGALEVWLPKSQIVTGINDDDYKIGDYAYTIEMPEWVAKAKGLI